MSEALNPDIFRTRAPLSVTRNQRALVDELMNAGIVTADAFSDDRPPFVFAAEASNGNLDSYYTRMHESTLLNFARDLKAGVSLLRGHNHNELGVGYSFGGQYQADPSGQGRGRVIADFYSVPGLPDTNDVIARIRGGLVRDVSVGFHGGQTICSICGGNMWRWSECEHWPGQSYTLADGNGNGSTPVVAFGWVRDARLSEVSLVYDGATPGCIILKAQEGARAGRFTEAQIRQIEHRIHAALPSRAKAVAVPADLDDDDGARIVETRLPASCYGGVDEPLPLPRPLPYPPSIWG